MSIEPSEQEVANFIRNHPGGCTLDDLAPIFGITRERVRQVEAKAVAKVRKWLERRAVRGVEDVV